MIKPFSHADLQNAVATALERSRRSEHDVRERLLAPTLAAALANAIEARDGELQGHCERLGELAVRVATLMGLDPGERSSRCGSAPCSTTSARSASRTAILLKNGRAHRRGA